jgi:16S rRNA (guanine966-N2)-methyltransferase
MRLERPRPFRNESDAGRRPGHARLTRRSPSRETDAMRIIAGQFKRRRLTPPPDAAVSRPMPDRVKEAVFNLLRGHFEGETVFDAFAGVGTIGLEALSRGASRVVMVEKDRKISNILKKNVEAIGGPDAAEIVVGDALGSGALSRCPTPVHLIFFDPPYPLVSDPARRDRTLRQFAALVQRLDDAGFAVLRTPWPLLDQPEGGAPQQVSLDIEGAAGPETHAYGSMAVHLYMKARVPGAEEEPDAHRDPTR